MVKVERTYTFDGPDGPVTLADLFGDRMQLITWHIMMGPDWDAACPTCTTFMNELSPAALAWLRDCQTAFALVSRAPLAKLEAYQASKGWALPRYSSHGSDFNYDFAVTLDHTDLPYALLDLTALGRQEAWEEPKGRAPVLR